MLVAEFPLNLLEKSLKRVIFFKHLILFLEKIDFLSFSMVYINYIFYFSYNMRRTPYRTPTIPAARPTAVSRKNAYSTRNNTLTVSNVNKPEQPNLVAINPRKISIGKTVQRNDPLFVRIGSFVVNVNRIDYINWNENESRIRFGSQYGVDASKKYYAAEHEAIRQLQIELTRKIDADK